MHLWFTASIAMTALWTTAYIHRSLVHFSFPIYLYRSPSSLPVDLPQAFATLNKIFLSSFSFFFHFFSCLFFSFTLTKTFLLETSERSPTSPDLFVSLVPPTLSFLLYSCHTRLSHVLLPPFKYSISLHLFHSLPSPELPLLPSPLNFSALTSLCFTLPRFSRGGFAVRPLC